METPEKIAARIIEDYGTADAVLGPAIAEAIKAERTAAPNITGTYVIQRSELSSLRERVRELEDQILLCSGSCRLHPDPIQDRIDAARRGEK